MTTYYLELMFIFLNIISCRSNEKGHTDRDLLFWKERTRNPGKKLDCKFNRINTSKENYDVDYELPRIKTFISEFKNKELRELEDKTKEINL